MASSQSLPTISPLSSTQSFSIMYGPVATWCSPYVDGFSASYCFAYSSGTGELTGRVRAPVTPAAVVLVSLISSVVSSGAVIPLMSGAPPVGLSWASLTALSIPSTPAR